MRTGIVRAVCWSKERERGVGKRSRPSARITRRGVPGDVHHSEWDVQKGPPVPNDRPITVVAAEAVEAACRDLGIPALAPGALGENLLVEGLGDLSELGPGSRVRVRGADGTLRAELHVTQQNRPCKNLKAWDARLPEALRGRRGLICTVTVEGEVSPGDRVETLPPA